MEILNTVLAGVTEVRGCLENDVCTIKEQQVETENRITAMDEHLCTLENIVDTVVNKD
jgi:hypothetical protein